MTRLSVGGRSVLVVLAILASLAAFGCGASEPPMRVRFADLPRGAIKNYTGRGPLIVEFQAGERLPVQLSFTGEDFELVQSGAPLEFVAKRHCFVRFDGDGVRASTDGQNFDEKPSQPGSFRFGLATKKDQPTALEIAIVTPKR